MLNLHAVTSLLKLVKYAAREPQSTTRTLSSTLLKHLKSDIRLILNGTIPLKTWAGPANGSNSRLHQRLCLMYKIPQQCEESRRSLLMRQVAALRQDSNIRVMQLCS